LSAGPTTGPISTYHPLYAVFKPVTFHLINLNMSTYICMI
jgi:hypothetical protein